MKNKISDKMMKNICKYYKKNNGEADEIINRYENKKRKNKKNKDKKRSLLKNSKKE